MTKAHPRLKRHLTVVAHSPDDVEIRHGVWNPVSHHLSDQSKSGRLFAMVKGLDGTIGPAELARRLDAPRSDIEALIDHLLQLDVLEVEPPSAFDFYVNSIVPTLKAPWRKIETIRPTRVIGNPELAGDIRRLLAECLPEEVLAPMSDDDAAWKTIRNPDIDWLDNGLAFERTMEKFSDWAGGFVVFAETVINPVRFQILNRAALHHGFAWLHAALDGPFVLVGPTFSPPNTPCYECLEKRVLMNLREASSYVAYKEALALGNVSHGPLPVEPVLRTILAGNAAMEAMNFLLTGNSFTMGKIQSIYLPTAETTFNEVLVLPGCPACGPLGERDDVELHFDMRHVMEG